MTENLTISPPLLELREVYKSYGSKKVLDGLSFSIERGGMIGLLGPNGCGKSTVIKLICGLLTTKDGEILVSGEPVSHETLAKIAYLPERNFLTTSDRIIDAVKCFADFHRDFDREKAMELLDALKLNPKTPIRALSKGNREKVQLILVMSRRAELYVLDEPMGGVDPAARDFILDTIMKNVAPESSVLISTHLIADIERVLDDVIFLSEGKAALIASVASLKADHGKSVDELFREVYRC